jgi:N6-L-threonylcarbamoyladenine synthase
MDDIGDYTLIGETIDDAIGEAFDKVAKMLDLPYPGGPQIEALALKGNKARFSYKAGRVKERPFDFSFSGLKTAVLYSLKGQNNSLTTHAPLTDQDKADVSAAFQHTAFTDIVEKTVAAAEKFGCKTLVFGGGVTNNQELRRLIALRAPHLQVLWPSAGLSLDNAAMIAGLGYHHYLKRGQGDPLTLEAATRIAFK